MARDTRAAHRTIVSRALTNASAPRAGSVPTIGNIIARSGGRILGTAYDTRNSSLHHETRDYAMSNETKAPASDEPVDVGLAQFTTLDPLKRAFLKAYASTGRVGDASRVVGVSRSLTWLWRKADPVFQELFDVAYQDFREELEAGAMARLAVGYEGKGGSDLLYITMMNAAWPEKYRATVVVDEKAIDAMSEVKAMVSKMRKKERAEREDKPEVSVQEQADAVVRAKMKKEVGGKA